MKKFSEFPVRVPNFKKAIEKINAFTEQIKNAKSENEIFKILRQQDRFSEALQTDFSIINVRYTLNVNDPFIIKAITKIDEESPYLAEPSQNFVRAILASPYLPAISKKYTEYFVTILRNSLLTSSPAVISEMIELNKLSSQYSAIVGSAKIEFRGETYNLSQMRKFTSDPNREIRREASFASASWYSVHNVELGEIYDKMVKLRHQKAIKLGFKSFTELGYISLGRTDYSAEDVRVYREQIKNEAVPLATKLINAQRRRIGLSHMYFYDTGYHFLDGNPIPNGTPDQLIEKAHEMYTEMGPITGDFFDLLRDNELLDVISRPGKVPGGYMTQFPKYKVPFVFANFNGTQGDVEVLTHEYGHAFQYYLSRNIKPTDFISPTLESCEIHSMSMEFIAWPWMSKFFDDVRKFKISHLEGAITFLPYGALVDDFQHHVYAHPEMTHVERLAKWRELEKQYMPYQDYEKCEFLEEGGYWLRQGHIFENPFYYIDYTLAQVIAFQFLVESQKDWNKAWRKYLKLCKMGGKYPFTSLLKHAHLRVPFEEGSLEKTFRPLKQILKNIS